MKTSRGRGARWCLSVVLCALGITTVSDRASGAAESALDRHAAEYLGLVADLAVLSPESVDFQLADPFGQPRPPATSLRAIADRSGALADRVRAFSGESEDARGRAGRLAAQLNAVAFRSLQLDGEQPSLDAELSALFELTGAEVQHPPRVDAAQARAELDRLMPGDGSLAQRLSAYQRRFVVPRGRLQAVVITSIEACRSQTLRLIKLPESEGLTVEYVAGHPWSGYSVYRGAYQSVMQVNRAAALTVGQVLNLACHEGYPGHHVYNVLRDERFLRERGWSETAALPLFSPEGVRAEAAASAAAAMVFTRDERAQVFREALFPLLGLDPRLAASYANVCELVDGLSGEVTRVMMKYLAGHMPLHRAVQALRQDALMEQPEGLLDYVQRYRAYSLAYPWGRDRLLAGLDEERALKDRADYLARLVTSSEWDLGRQQQVLRQHLADDNREEIHVEDARR